MDEYYNSSSRTATDKTEGNIKLIFKYEYTNKRLYWGVLSWLIALHKCFEKQDTSSYCVAKCIKISGWA